MKKGYFLLISILALALAGCSYEAADTVVPTSGKLRITLDIEDIDTGVVSTTRATVPAEENEEAVQDIYLLFYDYKSTGQADESGAWAATVAAPALTLDNPYFEIDYDGTFYAGALEEGNEYVILAIANLANYLESGLTVEQFLELMSTRTEKEALEQTALLVQGVRTNETDNSQKIEPDALPMSARVVIEGGMSDVTLRLIRSVARFDLEVPASTNYTLVSASIWGAAASTMLWDVTDVNATDRLQRFYGLQADEFISTTATTFKGGLYAFENYVAAPEPTDEVTTCVILGLAPVGSPGEVTYYRVNVNLSGAPQSLVRNHVYRIRLNTVSGAGEDNEYNAWKKTNTQLSYSINEWNIDDNGLVMTDGVNTLILPTKRVVLDPLGESISWPVFTKGNSTLRISRNSLNDTDVEGDGVEDINIFLDNNTLRVEAQPLPAGMEQRQGTIELSYAGLRGTITFIQMSEESRTFLMLDRYDIPDFLSLGRGGISDNSPLEVSASGPWTATIYNTSEDPYNPGFSFSTTTNPVTTLRSVDNPYRDMFTVYTTGDNARNEARHGFVIVTLDENPVDYQRVVVLTQLGNVGIALNPEVAEGTTLRFSGLGVPQGIAGASKEKGFIFTVDAGRTNGAPNPWTATIATGSGSFEVINGNDHADDDVQSNQFRVVAKGTNLTAGSLAGTVKIQISGGSTVERTLSLSQGTIGLTLSAKGTEVPKAGGQIEGVAVNIEPSMEWEASIVANDPTNSGYLVVSTGTGADKLVAGFPKIYYPQVNTPRQMEIEVKIKGSEPGSSTARLIVSQEPLTAKRVKILDVRNNHYGSLTSGSYFTYYRNYLTSSPLFGSINSRSPMPGGSEMQGLPPAVGSDPTTISKDYVYLHAGGVAGSYSAKRHAAIHNWWKNYGDEGILVFVNDDANPALFSSPVFQDIHVSYAGGGSGGSKVRLAEDQNTLIHDYLLKGRGPFGTVSNLDRTLYNDGISSTVSTTNGGSTAIPILSDGAGKTILFVDPVNNVVFIGEGQVFDIWMHAPAVLAGANGGSYPNNSKFLGNLLAYIVNSAQYGSHFSDLFTDEDLYNRQKALPNWADPY